MISISSKNNEILVFLPDKGEVSLTKESLSYSKDDEKFFCDYIFINFTFLDKKDDIESGKILLEKAIAYTRKVYCSYPIRTAIKKTDAFYLDLYLSAGFKVYSIWGEYALLEYDK